MTGNLSSNWANFQAEFEDYLLATLPNEEDSEVQAATFSTLMGSERWHVYKHNLGLMLDQKKDVAAILIVLKQYFMSIKNVIIKSYVFGNPKQEEGGTVDALSQD